MGKNILLVEDEILIALNQERNLKEYGYDVICVNFGEKAIELMNSPNSIDLILMDINLWSSMDGIEAAEIILKTNDIPIIFVSSHTEKKIVEKTERITSYGYVVKSSGITVLDASIKMAFKLFDAKKKLEEHEKELEKMYNKLREVNEKEII